MGAGGKKEALKMKLRAAGRQEETRGDKVTA